MNGDGYYMFVESSYPNNPNTGPFTITTPSYLDCVSEVKFSYHMYGSTMGTLSLEETTDGVTWTTSWNMTGDQGDSWQSATVAASASRRSRSR